MIDILLTDKESRFPEIYAIYEASFPADERRTYEGQKAVTEDARYRLLVAEEEGLILAFLGYWELTGCRFIEHLAVDERCRGKGVGKTLVQECVASSDRPVFLEIEPVSPEDAYTGRRAAFYERLGFVANHFPYEQLPLKEGDHPIPLWIMSYGKPYTEEEFLPFKREIYREVYHSEEG